MPFSPAALVEHVRGVILGESPSAQPTRQHEPGQFEPLPIDIVVVRVMLSRATRLPPDVVDSIFDHAEYWAHNTNYIDYQEEHKSPLRITGRSQVEDRFLLRSIPVGLIAIDDRKNLSEELAYDTNEAKPAHLKKELERKDFQNLVNYPIPRLVHPVRKVVFSIKSKDQGHGGSRSVEERNKGPYAASWTWFEAGLERFDSEQICEHSSWADMRRWLVLTDQGESHCTSDLRYNSPKSPAPSLPLCSLRPIQPKFKEDPRRDVPFVYDHPLQPSDEWTIQRNKTASREWQENVVTWSWEDDLDPDTEDAGKLPDEEGRGKATANGEFVRSLKLGDVLTVWGKARFPAWTNQVEKVKIDIYWAV